MEFDSSSSDTSLDASVTNLAQALQDAARDLMNNHGVLDTSRINEALKPFEKDANDIQDKEVLDRANALSRANALCSAVMYSNSTGAHPSVHLTSEAVGTLDWASLHVYTGFSSKTDPNTHWETLYIATLPREAYDNVKSNCPLLHPEKQANASPPTPGIDPPVR